MRYLIPIQETVKEIYHQFLKKQITLHALLNQGFFLDIRSNLPFSIVYEDNAACLQFAKMPKISPRTKHICLPYDWFKVKVASMEI